MVRILLKPQKKGNHIQLSKLQRQHRGHFLLSGDRENKQTKRNAERASEGARERGRQKEQSLPRWRERAPGDERG